MPGFPATSAGGTDYGYGLGVAVTADDMGMLALIHDYRLLRIEQIAASSSLNGTHVHQDLPTTQSPF
jgi:hypothetical protein